MALRAAAATSIARSHRKNLSPLSLSVRNFLGSKLLRPPPSTSSYRNLLISSPLHQSGLKHSVRAIGATTEPAVPKKDVEDFESPQNWKIKMLYDGDCPLCMREVNMLRERNKQYRTIKFVDISSDNYSPEENQGLDYKTVMGRIHAVLSDGTVVTDVEAFRRLYEQVGLGWVYAITKYKPIATLADVVYAVWAKYRLQVTGRPPIEEILEARKKNQSETCNDSSKCKV